jgi:glycosyltransferase involved in cell wall biosynthesis
MLMSNPSENFDINNKSNASHRIMLFDLATGGHHSSYIRHIVMYWCDEKLSANLHVVVSPHFIDEHSDIVNISIEHNQSQIKFIPITIEEYSDLMNKSSLLKRFFQEWNLYCKYASELKIEHSLLMYLDTLQMPIVFGRKSPCSFSGIYFRPTFHYQYFDNYVPSWKDSLIARLKKILLFCVLKNPQFKVLFCLDQFAIKYIEKINIKNKSVYLPDPMQIYNDDKLKIEELKIRLGIDNSRKVFLLFGSLEIRKGIYELLEAINLLSSDTSKYLCFVLAGSIVSSEKLKIKSLVQEISDNSPVQIITCDEFIPESEVHVYFQIADVILAPYQRHVGMSGILLLAAAAKKTILSSDYGLLGQLVRQYQLGITVDSTSPQAIADGIVKLSNDMPQNYSDIQMMDDFSKQYSYEKFSSVLIKNLFD